MQLSPQSSFRKFALAAATVLTALLHGGTAGAQPQPARVRVTFQPDCFRPSLSAACDRRKTGTRLDLGPQIAIWIEGADGRFVDTLMVTNLTALLGLGNRPGHRTLSSGPKFPYGRRPMVLPVWAHRRGKLYDSLVMQDGVEREFWLGFHEAASSPDPYYCRPMTLQEIDVDAITCPTQRFNSVKGRFFNPKVDLAPQHLDAGGKPKNYVPPPKSYYPPRNDLRPDLRNETDCDYERSAMCPMTARLLADINDLDSVAAATPVYGQPYTHTWRVPDSLADGNYVLFLEISKEFDTNASHAYPAAVDPMLREWGVPTNFGQPSVVFRVPFQLSRAGAVEVSTAEPAGYGDWDGATGTLHGPDSTLSNTPGSGVGRLLTINQPSLIGGAERSGKVLVFAGVGGAAPPDGGVVDAAAPGRDAGTDGAGDIGRPPDASACPQAAGAAPIAIDSVEVMAEEADIVFTEPTGETWNRAEGYLLKIWSGNEQSAQAFASGTPRPPIPKEAPGKMRTIRVRDLRSQTEYTVGIQPAGDCLDAHLGFRSFSTVLRRFKQLTGCFIATAAYGTPQSAQVKALRRVRDNARERSALAEVAADTYARSSPPVADVLRGSDAARAVARTLLAPILGLVE